MFMETSSIICILQCILLYSSSHLLLLKADKCIWPQKCGDLEFPYPFQLHKNTCGLPGFEIVCKRKSSSDPGIPYLPILSGDVKIKHLSSDHMLVDAASTYASPCQKEANVTNPKDFSLRDEGPFRISEFNKFFAVGCNTNGQFQMHMGSTSQEKPYSGSCTSICGYSTPTLHARQLPCKVNGCCQIPVPGGYTGITLAARFYSSYGSDNCSNSASAIVDKGSWDSISNSTSFTAADFSLRVSWAIPNDTCFSAQSKSSYQCSPNAVCKNRIWGYVCSCNTGYDGDGYTNGTGCTETKKCTGFTCFQTSSIIAGVFGTVIAVLLGGGSLLWVLKRRKSKRDKEKNFKRNGGDQLEKLISSRGGVESVKVFCLTEIEKATNKFSQNLILGSGGYGTVYKGTLTDGLLVAVKKSKEVDSKQIDQFINEVCILSQINHRNVVKLLGCCLETSVPLLVYEYISNGTLFDHLHDCNKKKQEQIPWEQRLRIATETAEALSYLHSAASTPIVHRDVKSSNILLDSDYNPKVADFGVSRLVPMGQTHITTVVQGTLGYLDPEYFQTVQLTEKSDVYSFGVVLAELLTGQRPVSYERMDNNSNLAIYFISTVNTMGVGEIIDPRLDVKEGKIRESMRRVAALAKECLGVEGEKRPSMKEVVQELLWSKGGERPHAWVNNDPEEMEELIVVEDERIGAG